MTHPRTGDDSPPALRLALLGPFRLWRGAAPVHLPSRPARTLLAVLALQMGQPVERARLLALLWPDQAAARARRSLSQALWLARQALPELRAALDADPERLCLRVDPADPGALWVDVARFRQALASTGPGSDAQVLDDQALEAVQAGLELYQGELLSGWDDDRLLGDWLLNDWLLDHRRALHGLWLSGLEALTRAYERRQNPARALETATRWADADPLSEEAHGAVMRLAASLGRMGEALAGYERLTLTLRRELGSEPGAQIQRLYQRLRRNQGSRDTAPAPGPRVTTAPLIGRERERGHLLSALERGRQNGAWVLLEAESGLGKSRLLRQLVTDAQWRGLDVLWGQGREFAQTEPFAALRGALEDALTPARALLLAGRLEPVWRSAAAPLLPALLSSSQLSSGQLSSGQLSSSQLSPGLVTQAAQTSLQLAAVALPDEPLRLREGLRRVLLALAASGPSLLIIDDLHWADAGSLEVLRALAQTPPPGLSVVLAYRPEAARERPDVWAALEAVDAAGAQRLSLAPLSAGAAAELARASLDLGGGLSALDLSVPELGALATRLARDSGGHPLYLLESLRALVESGALRQEHGTWHAPLPGLPLPLSDGLRSAVLGRLVRLSSSPRRLLDSAALLAESAPPGVLLEAAGLEPGQADALEALTRRGWLEERGGQYGVAHDLVRGVLVGELAEPERAAHHARLAAALSRLLPERAALIARHFQAARDWPQAALARLRAAQQARHLHDYPAVLAQLGPLLEDGPLRRSLAPPTLTQALELHWQANGVAGDLEAQTRDLESLSALAVPDTPAALLLETRRAELLSRGGQVEAALALAARVRDQGQARRDPALVAQAESSLRAICSAHGRLEEAVMHGMRATTLWRELGETAACARALFTLGGDEMYLAHAEAAAGHIQEALGLFEAQGDRLGQADTLGSLAIIEDSRNQRARSRTYQLRALETHRDIGSLIGTGRCLANLAWMDADRNHLAQGLKLYQEALELFVSIADTTRAMHVRRGLTGLLIIQLGRWEEANAQLAITEAYFTETGNQRGQWYNLDARMYLAVQQGEYSAALNLAEQMRVLALAASDHPCELMARWSAARLRTQRGDAGSVETFAALRAEIEALEMPGMTGEYDGQMGAALLRADRPAEALLLIEASLQASQGEEKAGETEPRLMPELHHLRALALEALGRPGEAAAALDRAHRELSAALDGLDRPELTLDRVPEWRELVRDWEERRLRKARVALPGRRDRVRAVDVQLTLEAPEDLVLRSKPGRRQARLARVLHEADQQGAAPRLSDLARLLGCGTATIKRDLAALRRRAS
jgi:DNA-binding SARP family transcriptional activator